MYRKQYGISAAESLTCPECASKRFRVGQGKVVCTNCGWTEKTAAGNKYGAKRTLSRDGMKRDSKFEASQADELDLRKRGKDILDYESQYKVTMWIYREDGVRAFKVEHKVDFRIHHNDGSFELLEAKGVETADWKWRRRLLEELWLPLHKDHDYTVVKQQKGVRYR
jgi:uncharacterized Zn finger protein (UPF0148 family)